MTAKSCIVIEHEDGSVTVNGPYDTYEKAVIAARTIGQSMALDEDRVYQHRDDGCAIERNSDDTTDVYARTMGEPIGR